MAILLWHFGGKGRVTLCVSEYLYAMSLFLFPGSFDPVTLGHIDLIDRALCFADRLLVVVAQHPEKKGFFTVEERIRLLETALDSRLDRVGVVAWPGLIAELVQKEKAQGVIRGVRDSVDLVWEQRLHEANLHLLPGFETILMPASPQYRWISSSLVRELLERGEKVDQLLPPAILPLLSETSS